MMSLTRLLVAFLTKNQEKIKIKQGSELPEYVICLTPANAFSEFSSSPDVRKDTEAGTSKIKLRRRNPTFQIHTYMPRESTRIDSDFSLIST